MIKLLDCTLRDGGYINDWNFGNKVIYDILKKSLETGVEIIEAGFLRNVIYDKDIAVFPDTSKLDAILNDNGIKKGNKSIALMAEISNPVSPDNIESSDTTNVDIIRVIVWKTKRMKSGKVVDALKESYEYCKEIAKKGYKLCIQPNRTDQYSDEEFVEMLKMFAELKPYAIYVVDSWGTMYSDKVLHYMQLADSVLEKGICIGFHGHNNMMQAFSTAEKIAEREFDRDIILDACIDGMGRGAGNLNLELIARYLNCNKGCNYNMRPIYEIYDTYIRALREKYTWGSSFAYMLSADKNINPNYAAAFENKMKVSQMNKVYDAMKEDDKIIYNAEIVEKYT